MRINVLNDINSEIFSVLLEIREVNGEVIYKVTFDDIRMREKYGTFEIVKGLDFWKLPMTNDRSLISMSSEIIYGIMELESNQ
ncbi:hypothetical protein [uncultured Kordia sp.]|uniref:hypothetical protein n=1 Tax=uncultured Kordia sp. TaxID=507699 RepID=UPI00261F0B88|nr:hypothetical protein [uncultured Kordia sp.]